MISDIGTSDLSPDSLRQVRNWYGWGAIGEMAHAEMEIIRENSGVAEAIRAARIQYIEYLNSADRKKEDIPDMFPLIMMVTTLKEINDKEGAVNLFNQPGV